MKKILMMNMLLVAFTTSAMASTSLECTGKGWVHFVAVPFPLYKTLNAYLTLDSATHGSLELSAGGDPLFYQGPLALDGSQPALITNPDSGDVTALMLVMEDPKTLKIAVQFSNAQHEKTGSISPTNLTCK